MSEVLLLRPRAQRDDTLWAVIASLGAQRRRRTQVAEIYPNREAALADCHWRTQQVRDYASFLKQSNQLVPQYSIAPIRRADLPRSWRPSPALGFLNQFQS